MSKECQFICISPPQYPKEEEKIESAGHECPNCRGTGLVAVYDEGYRTDQKAVCARCGGSGRLRADIVIKWEAEQ